MASDSDLRAAAHDVIKQGDIDALKTIVRLGAATSDCAWQSGYFGKTEAIQWLVENKANIDQALLGATHSGSMIGLESAIELKANIEVQDSLGNTPLCWAVRDGHTAIVRTLLLHKADSNATLTTMISKNTSLLEVSQWLRFRDGRNEVIRELLTLAPAPPAPPAPMASAFAAATNVHCAEQLPSPLDAFVKSAEAELDKTTRNDSDKKKTD
jgi:ankyrin repeat protein